jgi:hypothetical protein
MQCSKFGALLDHLVGELLEMQWHLKAKRFGGLEVDHHFELGRQLHRQLRRLGALENAIDVGSRLPKPVVRIHPVRHQATVPGKEAERIYGGQVVASCKGDDKAAIHYRRSVRQHDQATVRLTCKSTDCALDFSGVVGRCRN